MAQFRAAPKGGRLHASFPKRLGPRAARLHRRRPSPDRRARAFFWKADGAFGTCQVSARIMNEEPPPSARSTAMAPRFRDFSTRSWNKPTGLPFGLAAFAFT